MHIRNFCIIAHIDHGKSTLADRMLEITGAVRKIDHNQMLDRMDIEQERGITIKLTPARMQRKGYEFNLIDTPGHVDFQYEVSRSLAAVEGAILLVDASQGIQAQTLSVLYQAIDQHLTIIPVLNKIDLPAANPERVAHEIENVIGIDKSEIIQVSGKTGENVEAVLDAIIERIEDPLAFKDSHPKKYWPVNSPYGVSSSSNSFSFREGELQKIAHEVSKSYHIYGDAGGFQTGFARDMRKHQTVAEEIMREVLRNRRFLGMKRRRQFPINRYIADFYCHEEKVIIEIDGGIHNTEEQKIIDSQKTQTLENLGYKVIRFTNKDVIEHIESVLKKIETVIPLSEGEGGGGEEKKLTRALIFDSVYDTYKGVLAYVKVVDGELQANQNLHLIHTDNDILPTEVGHFTPEFKVDKVLKEGQIGYIITGERSVRDVSIGDTIISGLPKMKKPMITEDKKITEDKSDEINKLTYDIIGCAMEVHKHLGGGNREKNYQLALMHELEKKGLQIKKEVKIDLMYKDVKLANQYADLVINDKVILELKSKGFLQDIDYKQIRTYLNSSDMEIGLLLDFGGRKLLYKRLEKDYSSYNLPSSSEINLPLSSYIIPGFKRVKPFVYAGVYPLDTTDYDKLKDSLEKLSINDSAIEYELEDSKALGFGFRCGFLGMLHMDIVRERLSREYNMETIFTIPTVIYLIKTKNLSLDSIKSGSNINALLKTGMYKHILGLATTHEEAEKRKQELAPWLVVKSGSDMIDQGLIDEIREPIATVEVVGPQEYAGNIMALCQEYRGKLINMDYIDETRVVRHYELPFGEIIIDFYDRLKSATKGYATMNYEFKKYAPAELVKLDVYINNEKVEALSRVVHKDKSYYLAKDVVEKLKTLIPKHLFVIPLQVGIGGKMIARENISAMRKDVIAKCYGGDVSRKRKLLAKQKEGKKKMKSIGSVNVPSDVFIKMVARGD